MINRLKAAISFLDRREICSRPLGTRPWKIRAKDLVSSFFGTRCTLQDIGTTSHEKFWPLLFRNARSMYASAVAPRDMNGTLYLPLVPLHLPDRAAASERLVSLRIVALVYSNGLLRMVGSIASHCPGTPVSAQTFKSDAIVISCPRNFHIPISVVPDVKFDSGIENPDVPGAKFSPGVARPVTDNIWLSSV